MAKKSMRSKMKDAEKQLKEIMAKKKEEDIIPKKSKTVKETYKEIKASLKPKISPEALEDNYEEFLKQQLFKDEISKAKALEDAEESEYYNKAGVETPLKERDGLWDYLIDDEIEHFDPEMSYEITGYRPISETEGLDFDPAPFCETGRIYTETGSYTEYPKDSKPYNDFWREQLRRSTEGLTIGKYRITGDHYFFLNFYRMSIVDDTSKAAAGDNESFPKFVIEQYKWFHYIEMCEYLKKDIVGLKSRGVGFSEVAASLGVRPFITTRNYRTVYVAYTDAYVDGVLDKCWRQLNWLNNNTNGGMKRARQKIDNIKQKRASRVDKEGNEYGRFSEIEGIVADNPRKVRGDRCHRLMYEESGSNPWLRTEWTQGEALVTVAGARKGIRCGWGCVCAGTDVFKADGTSCKVEDITKDTGILGFNGYSGNKEPVTYIQPTGYKDCVSINTSLGGSISCSTDHPLLTLVKNGNRKNWYCTFKNAGDISINDTLLMANNIECFGDINEPDAYLLGMLFGDGSYTKGANVTLSVTTEEVFSWLSSKYHVELSKLAYSSDGIYAQVYFPKRHQLLKKYGMDKQSWEHKKFPDSIWQWDKMSICDFIGGYFEADGNVQIIKKKHRAIKLTSKYEYTVNTVQQLLLKLGINSYISKETKKSNGLLVSKVNKTTYNIPKEHICYVLYIDNSYYINKFKSLIRFKSIHKQERLDSYSLKINRSIYNNIPFKLNKNNKGKFFIGKDISNIQGVNVKSIKNIGIQRIYNLTANSTHTYLTNRFISANTGGDSDSKALQGLSEMFNDPDAYNILPYKNNYSDDGTVQYTGFFLPSYSMMLKTGFVDHRGVTFLEKAKEHYISNRKKKSGQALLEYCAEYCFTPSEALLRQGDGIFDPIVIADRLTQLRIQKVGVKPQRVDLVWDCPNVENNPRNKVKLLPNSQGKVYIYEPPQRDGEGNFYKNLYVAGIDSIDQGTADSSTNTDVSDFCIVIKKRILGSSMSNYVAIYKDRPRDIVTAYENAMKLLVYYNCKAMLEHTKISIIMYFRSKKKENLFMSRPKSTLSDIRRGNSSMVGYPATETYLRHGLELISRFIDESCYSLHIDEMLEQLLKYSWESKRKFDIVAAMIAAELGDEDLMGFTPKAQDEITTTWKDFGWYYDSYGNKRYGTIPI